MIGPSALAAFYPSVSSLLFSNTNAFSQVANQQLEDKVSAGCEWRRATTNAAAAQRHSLENTAATERAELESSVIELEVHVEQLKAENVRTCVCAHL